MGKRYAEAGGARPFGQHDVAPHNARTYYCVMRFLNRTGELAQLDALANREEGGLAVLWGRRRVGKTRLLLEWCRGHRGLYTVADSSAPAVQRRYVAQAIGERLGGFAEVEYPDWRALLRALARACSREGFRGPLVFDELPYLVTVDPSLATVLQAWIDHEAREARLIVAVCGSAQHMMQGLALDASAPLFGRASVILPVTPMSPAALAKGLGLREARDAVAAFAAWGGVPRYWELAEPYGGDLDRAVAELVLDPLGPLHREPDRLLAEELPQAGALRPVLDAIGSGAHRVSEIGGRLGQPATSLGRPLGRLIELGLVHREQPFGEPERGGKRSLYRISDPFFRLWFKVVAPHRGWLAAARRQGRLVLWRRSRGALVAEAWEELCRQAVPGLARRGGPLERWGEFAAAQRYWRGSGPEWDVVARALDGRTTVIGEVKWHERPGEDGELRGAAAALEGKGVPPGVEGEVVRVVFVPVRPRGRRERHGVVGIDAADVLGALG